MPYCNTNGIKLFYQESGQGEPVLFLHGLGSCGEDWQDQIDAFSHDYRVITVDTRGHGRSDKPLGPYNMPTYASDVINLLDHLGIKRCHLVGFSMGGMIAFQIAADAPERLNSLTIVNSAPAVPYNTLSEKLEFCLRIAVIRLFGMKLLARIIGKRLFPEARQKSLYQRFITRMQGNPTTTYIEVIKSLIGWDVRPTLGNLEMPVLIISADNDYTPVSYKTEYANKISTANLVVINNSRHATPIDQPQQLNKEVFQFLESLA
ncbi:alpha/beta hydrolase [Maricurvus nonylphenolicus]|uniref:alpha/beta fold hydrolase n=1 Tax=Maricurvus nonylphenolicus TaxID=1008307 RepID=UPI0036F3719D